MSEIPLPNPVASAAIAPTIADVSYRNYDGPLKAHAVRWWVVALATIRQNVNRRRFGYWIPAVLIAVVYLFMAILFYVTFNVRQQIEAMGSAMPNAPANPFALTLYQCISGTGLLLFSAALTVGSASIAADNRANALLVYLSKPITRTDYLIGKWMGIFLLLAALSTLPSLLLYLFFLVAYFNDGFLAQNGALWWRVIIASMVAPALHTSLIIGFSAWSKTPRVAGATYAAFYFVISILAQRIGFVLLERTENGPNTTATVINSMHIDGIAAGIAMNLYDITPQQVIERFQGGGQRFRRRNRNRPKTDSDETRPAFRVPDRPPLAPLALLGGLFLVLPVAAAAVKVRAVEVIRG